MARQGKPSLNLFLISLSLAANFFIIHPVHAAGEVIINEIAWMGTLDSANSEWIELYNTTNADIDLTGWTLMALDGTPSINITGTIPAGGYFLLERTDDDTVAGVTADQIYTGVLENSGEQLELKDAGNVIIDSVDQSSGWIAGDNATKQTMERADSGWQTSLAIGGTPKTLNSNGDGETEQNNPPPASTWSFEPSVPSAPQVGEIVINELVSDPADGGQEWVELYNRSSRTIDLSHFTLSEGSGVVTTLSGSIGTYEAGRYLVIYSPKGNLNNAGDIIILKYQDTIIDQVTYGNWDDGKTTDNAPTAPDPNSLARLPDGVDTNNDAVDLSKTSPTPGSKNILTTEATNNNTGEAKTTSPTGKLSINELYPNPPLGDLEKEFIELINLSSETIDLNGWGIADDITTYIISSQDFTSTYLAPGQIFLLPRLITGIALDNNNNEKITLRSPDGKSMAAANYSGPAAEGLSWARSENSDWLWSTVATPGKNNSLNPVNKPPLIYWELPAIFTSQSLLIFDASDTVDPNGDALTFKWDFGDDFGSNVITPTHIYSSDGKYTLSLTVTDSQGLTSQKTKVLTFAGDSPQPAAKLTTSAVTVASPKSFSQYLELDEVKKLSSRAKVVTAGVVAVSTGVFNKDLFLSGSGLQLYLNNGAWPSLAPGDRVQVSGTVSQTQAYGSRLLVAKPEDLHLLEKVTPPPPTEMVIADLSENYEGWLIRIKGEVTRKDKTSVTLLDGDKTIKANYKNAGPWPDLALNSQASVTGFLVLADGEFRLWPRDADDIVSSSTIETGRVAGATDTVITPTKNNWLGYIFIALAALVIIAGWWWEKHGRPKPGELWQKIWKKQ